jgi:hypothetical protein
MAASAARQRPATTTWVSGPTIRSIIGACSAPRLAALVAAGAIRKRQLPGAHPKYVLEDAQQLASPQPAA